MNTITFLQENEVIQSTLLDSLQGNLLSLLPETQERAMRVWLPSQSNACEWQSDMASKDHKEADSGVERQLSR